MTLILFFPIFLMGADHLVYKFILSSSDGNFYGFDLIKFSLWFVLPLLIHRRRLGEFKSFFKFSLNLKESIIVGLTLICLFSSVWLISFFPSLKNYYSVENFVGDHSVSEFIIRMTLWNLSWLLGWELMVRLTLFSSIEEKNWKHLLWYCPLVETIYHFDKPLPEMAGVFVFSLALTMWMIKTRKFFYAFFAHFLIESALVFFLLSHSA